MARDLALWQGASKERYEDFLRQRGLRQWTNEEPQAQAIRALAVRGPSSASDRSGLHDYAIWLETTAPGLVANAIICLIHQANDLLHQQIRVPEHTSSTADGARELQHEPHDSARVLESRRQSTNDPIPAASPTRPTSAYIPGAPGCPKCGKIVALRTVREAGPAGTFTQSKQREQRSFGEISIKAKGARPGSQF